MRIRESLEIDAPPERVWELVGDPTRYPALLDWVTSFRAEDPASAPGVGCRYGMRVKVGSAEIGGLVELVEYERCREVAWTSITGVEQRGRVRLRPCGDGRTQLSMRVSYDAPGLLLGTLADLLSAPQVSASVRRSLLNIKLGVEGGSPPAASGSSLPRRLLHEGDNLLILARSGMLAPMRPDRLARVAWRGARWGASPATGVLVGAARHPERAMIVDELGTLSYAEVDRRSDAVAAGLREAGLRQEQRIGLMCRDHRGFVEAVAGAGKLGLDVLLLNTSFAGPQLAEVSEREQVAAIVHDEEFTELLGEVPESIPRFLAWHEGEGVDGRSLGELYLSRGRRPGPPGHTSHVTILTSGTTGTPKGASRTSMPLTLDPAAALLERIPLHEGDTVRIAAPLFHAWGFSNFALGMALGATFVLRRRFDPEQCLRDIEEHGCQALVVVPVMLQRILALPEKVRGRYDTSALRAVCASGSALPGDLATRWMDAFGENLYNMYGSTEVAVATLATPRDMRAAPGTAGKPARGCVVRLYAEDGRPVLQGETGRIFVGNQMLFEGYTGGGDKDRRDGLMATGDVGRFDEAGRLFVVGRDDEMIVSGGENVFPKEVEDALAAHPAVAEAAAIGVEDEDFGQRLRAFVVLAQGAGVDAEELKAHVRSQLARYKVPREIVFLDELPRNPTGKVLKRELAERD